MAASAVIGSLLALRPVLALAHGAPPPDPTFPGVLLAWSFDPLPLVAVGAAAFAYLRAVREVNAAHPRSPVPSARPVAFLAGLAAILLALQSPVDRYETALISVHMVQHMLLQFVAAPLLLLGAPVTLALRVAPPPVRAGLIAVLHSRALRTATHPLVAWTVFVAVNWGWQFSPLYNLALESDFVHYLQHAVYLGSALLFWWPIAGIDPAPRRLAFPGRAAYLAMAIPQNSFLGITLMSTSPDLYPHYQTLVRDWGPSVVEDLTIAGSVMWGMGAMVFVIAHGRRLDAGRRAPHAPRRVASRGAGGGRGGDRRLPGGADAAKEATTANTRRYTQWQMTDDGTVAVNSLSQ
ncbi:MAG: cytochrome c oxidase assembly protein [Chloroflexota bacterium]